LPPLRVGKPIRDPGVTQTIVHNHTAVNFVQALHSRRLRDGRARPGHGFVFLGGETNRDWERLPVRRQSIHPQHSPKPGLGPHNPDPGPSASTLPASRHNYAYTNRVYTNRISEQLAPPAHPSI
jgi:hypothetical protein